MEVPGVSTEGKAPAFFNHPDKMVASTSKPIEKTTLKLFMPVKVAGPPENKNRRLADSSVRVQTTWLRV
jgi:hypothetical protein